VAASVGYSGIVTSWASNTQLIATGAAPASFTLTESADSFPSTVMGASLLANSNLKGLRSWTVGIEAIRPGSPAGQTGHTATVAFAPGYVANCTAFDINFQAAAFESTIMGASDTTNRWKQFLPGLISWSGSYTALVDDTTATVSPAGTSEPATMTLTVSTGLSFAGSVFTTGATRSVNTQGISTIDYTFVGSGNVTVTGATLPFAAASSIAIPAPGSLVLTAASGRTFTGSAFWTGVRMRTPVAGQITTSITAQGSGALTIA
jgi:hypothetical protein